MSAQDPIHVGRIVCAVLVIALSAAATSSGDLYLGPAEFVQADGVNITVPGYSVPSFVDWNNDGLKDLVVGEGGGTFEAKVRIYLNVGTAQSPQFSTYAYAQSGGADLVLPGGG